MSSQGQRGLEGASIERVGKAKLAVEVKHIETLSGTPAVICNRGAYVLTLVVEPQIDEITKVLVAAFAGALLRPCAGLAAALSFASFPPAFRS